jgi:hypothetical protein
LEKKKKERNYVASQYTIQVSTTITEGKNKETPLDTGGKYVKYGWTG